MALIQPGQYIIYVECPDGCDAAVYERGNPVKPQHTLGVMGVLDWDSRSRWFLVERGDWYIFRPWFDVDNPFGPGSWGAADIYGLGDWARILNFRPSQALEGRTVDNDKWQRIQQRMHADLMRLRND